MTIQKDFNYCPECGAPLTSDLRCTKCSYDAVKDIPRDYGTDSINYIPPKVTNDNAKPANERAEKNKTELKAAGSMLMLYFKAGPKKVATEMYYRDSPIIGTVYLICFLLFFPLSLSLIFSTSIDTQVSGGLAVHIWIHMITIALISAAALIGSTYGLAKAHQKETQIVQTVNATSTTLIPVILCSALASLLTFFSPYIGIVLLVISAPLFLASLYLLVSQITKKQCSYWKFAAITTIQSIIGLVGIAVTFRSTINKLFEYINLF